MYDLGSGDGRIPIAAVQRLRRRALRPASTSIRSESRKRPPTCRSREGDPGISKNVRFLNQDLFTTDISDATVVTLYLLPSLNLKLIPKFKAELKPGTRIVSHSFDMMGEWEPEQTIDVDGRTVYYWTIPKK